MVTLESDVSPRVYKEQRRCRCIIRSTLMKTLHSKKLRVVENRMEQCFAAHIAQCCQQYCPALLHLIAGWIQAQQLVQYC